MPRPSLLGLGRKERRDDVQPSSGRSADTASAGPLRQELRDLRRLFAHISEGIYIARPDGTILHGNRAALRIFGADSIEALRQHRIDELFLDPNLWRERHRLLQHDDRIEDVVYEIRGLDGETRRLRETVLADRGPDGEVRAIHGIVTEVTDSGETSGQARQGTVTPFHPDAATSPAPGEGRRLKIQAAVASASERLVTETDPDLEAILGEVAAVVDVERAMVFQLGEAGARMDNTHEWCREGTESRKAFLQRLPSDKYSWLLERLGAGDNLVIPDVAALPGEASRERSALQARGVVSCLLVPLRSVTGELIGFAGFENFEERREWSPGDAQALRIVSEMIATHLERGRARQALRENEERFGLLSEQVPAIVWTTDEEMRLMSVIGSGLAKIGLDGRDAVGKKFQEFLPVDPSDSVPVRSHRQALEGSTSSFERQWKDCTFQIQVKPFRDGDGNISGALGIALDVTEHRAAEAKNRRQERFLTALVDSNPLAIVALNSEDVTVSCNPAFVELFGYPEDEVLGKDLDSLIVPEAKRELAEDLSRQVQGGRLVRCESQRRRKDGSLVDVDIYGVPVVVDDEQIGIYAIYKDITDRKTKERQIRAQLRRQSVLRNISAAITSTLDIDRTLRVLLEQIIHKLEADAVAILLLDHETQTLRFAKGQGFSTEALQHTSLEVGQGFAGRAAQKRCIVTLENLDDDAGELSRAPLLEKEGFRTYYAAPVMAKGKVEGVLEIFYREPFTGDEAWLEFLEALATQAAIAIENARMFDDLQRSHESLQDAYDTTLEGWSRALEMRDQETEGHTRRVTQMTVELAELMGLPEEEIKHVRRGALLHDIGKMGIPDSILLKPGKLTDEEWEVMRRHPTYAYELLYPIEYLRPALDIPHYHHEKWDGSGYPEGLRGEDIPLSARLFAIVDVWDALRSDRPYRNAWDKQKVTEYVREQSGQHFDPKVVETFLDNDIGY